MMIQPFNNIGISFWGKEVCSAIEGILMEIGGLEQHVRYNALEEFCKVLFPL